MANNTLNTRIILCNDTSLNWSTSEKVLLKGELGIELTDGVPKVKIGDGVNKYVDLAYVTMTPAEITAAISAAVEGAKHTHDKKDILDPTTATLTTPKKNK